MHNKQWRARMARAGMIVLLACAPALYAHAQSAPDHDIETGQLALHWGDPQPAPRGQKAKPMRLRAQLVTDDGRRIALAASDARRAAVDLPALTLRRVAVAFGTRAESGKRQRVRYPEVIVPADGLPPVQTAPGGQVMANAPVMAAANVIGNTRWITLMCKFSDIPTEQKDRAFFQSQYGTAIGQLGHYWSEVSYGRINLAGSTANGWFTLPSPRSSYVTVVDGEDDADLDRLFQDCVTAADATVDFTGVQGINMMFNGELDGYAWGGGSCATFEGSRRCTRVTWNPPWSFGNLAPLAHEMGHGYGLPHSDNSDGDDDTYDNPWDVMSDSWSNALSDPVYGTRPKHIAMIQRDRLGWVGDNRKLVLPYGIGGVREYLLQFAADATPLVNGKQLIVLSMPSQANPAQNVTYTLEARRRVGDYESRLAGDAVIIHRVVGEEAFSQDANVPPADRANNEGSMFKPGESWTSPDGAFEVRVGGMLEQGFLVTILASSNGQHTGGNHGARRSTRPVGQNAQVQSNSTPSAVIPASTYRRAPATRRPAVRKDRAR